jgi:hypothetical protein
MYNASLSVFDWRLSIPVDSTATVMIPLAGDVLAECASVFTVSYCILLLPPELLFLPLLSQVAMTRVMFSKAFLFVHLQK